ncbi:hypothetical protein H0A36_16165 [Endozoicomonas sp. SM1973]|uniref:Uncharacterized protein n=1 Tax=Spartinivicinus marinus TaxID=2994442 RepID=A0A853I784_9GAMM|nr:hypothetical protein [Spartinivicinus marinus]MCX4029778.1 hypothetical protein [Spartinivicinus marinus]NYZ67552.1 hypothetical protein [Spartinivicinus marinus]
MPTDSTLQQDILIECKAMMQYAFASGLKVPANLAASLEAYELESLQFNDQTTDSPQMELIDNTTGNTPNNNLPKNNAHQLSLIHNHLADLIAPARPKTLLLLASESQKSKWITFLGPVPLIRHMILVAIAALISFITLSLSSYVNGMPSNFSLLENSGISLLVNELFLLAAAAIGASFAGLFQANYYIKNRTFDEIHGSSYWIRFVLGLLSGIIVASLIPIETISENEGKLSASLHGLGKPVLALLGGFSASVVYRVLYRLASAVESIIQSDVKESITLQENAAKSRINEQLLSERMQISSKLTNLQHKLSSQSQLPDNLMQEFQRIQQELVNPDFNQLDLPEKPPKPINSQDNNTNTEKAG